MKKSVLSVALKRGLKLRGDPRALVLELFRLESLKFKCPIDFKHGLRYDKVCGQSIRLTGKGIHI